MANIKFTNFARSKVATGIGAGDTTLAITGGTGALFPALTGAEYFYLTLENSSLVREIVKVTARTTDTLTIVRAQDGTTAVAWVAGDVVSLRFNAAAISEAVTGTLLAANNLSDVANAATARANIGAVTSGDYIGAATATTQTPGDNSTKVATTAYVLANAQTTPSASETVQGKVELATNAEVLTGTDTARAVTPAGLNAVAFGVGQTYKTAASVGKGALSTTYTNTSNKATTQIAQLSTNGGGGGYFVATVDGVSIPGGGITAGGGDYYGGTITFIVPPGKTYSLAIIAQAGSPVLRSWIELS